MKTRKVFALCGRCILMALFLSCASFPEFGTGFMDRTRDGIYDAIAKSGVTWSRAFEEITPEQEYYIGRAVAASILSGYRILTTRPAMTSYVNQICQTLVINSPRPDIYNGYRVNILNSEEINAFATPGGHIFITWGLIEQTRSEDTLAAIIAHEIAHIQLEHGLKAIRNSRFRHALRVTGASTVGVVAAALDITELTNIFRESTGEIVSALQINGYSQFQEFEADSTAMALLSLSGYEPSSLIEVLEILEKNQSDRRGGFNNTHPDPARRISNAQRTVANYSVPDTRSHREARYRAAMGTAR